jgi:hypothetical protein
VLPAALRLIATRAAPALTVAAAAAAYAAVLGSPRRRARGDRRVALWRGRRWGGALARAH